jgi:23S rRNA pseudouridine1911/1915/1917 synthase
VKFIYQPSEGTQPQSLEAVLSGWLAWVSRAQLKQWIKAGHITVDGHLEKPGAWLEAGQVIEISQPAPVPHAAEPQNLGLPIHYQDEHLVVISKPAGMATHPGPGWWKGSCINGLLYEVTDWPGIGGVAGPGIVHRLDVETTGLLIFAKTDQAHQGLLKAILEKRVEREYVAVVEGRLLGDGVIDAPLGRDSIDTARVCVRPDGKPAVTRWRSLETTPALSLLALRLETGRTHQIRVHLASSGHPVWGDARYGQKGPFLALHAKRLALKHPVTGEPLEWHLPPPASWEVFGFQGS